MQSFHNMSWQQPTPVPRIHVSDATAYQQASPQFISAATNSSNSFSDINDPPFDFESISPQSKSFHQPLRSRATSNASSGNQSFEELCASTTKEPLPVLSGIGSVHNSGQIPLRHPVQRPLFSSHAHVGSSTASGSWSNVTQQGVSPSHHYTQPNNPALPALDSDDFSLVGPNCSRCLSKDDRLTRLETEMRKLSHQMQEYENTMRIQHNMIKSQQQFISELGSQSTPLKPLQSRKRRLPATETQLVGATSSQQHDLNTSNKRGRFPPEQRKQTAETRQRGACIKCWKHKQRCDPGLDIGGPCKRCQEMSLSLSLIQLPCIRTRITDLQIFRCGTGHNDTWTRREEVELPTDLSTYISDKRKCLTLTHGFGPELNVNVREYRLVRDESNIYVWRDGQGQEHCKPMPDYALSEIEQLRHTIQAYVNENQVAYINKFVNDRDIPTQKAFNVAMKMAGNSTSILLQKVLQLWTAARLIEKPWQLTGDETLGLEADNHWWWIPITPMMDTQLDQVVIKTCLMPLRKEVLQMLQAKIEKGCQDNWLEIIVAIVILLNTIEEATRHDHEFATFFGHEYAPDKRRFEDYKLIESYFHSALTLLTHVKVAFEGRLPYLDAKTNVSKLVSLCQNEDEKDYMIETDRYISAHRRKMDFDKIRQRHQYEARQFWVHQLFLKEWHGKSISIREVGEV